MSEQTMAEQLLALNEASSTVLARVDGTTLYMSSPFKKSAVPLLGRDGLGGKWKKENKEWAFPIHWFEKVRDVYREQFGTAGMKTTTLIRATIDLDQYMDEAFPLTMKDEGMDRRGLYLMQNLPVAFFRTDNMAAGVRLIQNVTVVQGGFYIDGDDPKTATIHPYPATVLSLTDLDMRVTVRMVSDLLNGHSAPKSKAVQLFGGDAGTVETETSLSGTKASGPTGTQSVLDRVDDSLKDKAKEFETLLRPVSRTLIDKSLPASMVDKLLSAYGFERA